MCTQTKQERINIMAKKNLKISALKYEIYHNIEQTLEVLQQLGFVAKSEVFSDSLAEDWLYNEPSNEDMNKVLNKLGYKL